MVNFTVNPFHQVIIFAVLVTLMVPSILCSLYLFYQFLRLRVLRTRVTNHLVLLLLVVDFIQVVTELPFNLVLLHTGVVMIRTNSFCIFWNIYNFTLVGVGLFALAYGCIERYLFVFYRVYFTQHLLILHYVPFTFFVAYPLLFYTYAVAIHPCVNSFSFEHALCGRPCYEYQRFVGGWDWIVNLTLPVLITILTNVFLLIRFISQKRRATQRFMWRKNRRVINQLLSVAILYMVVWIPILVCFLMVLFSSNTQVLRLSVSYLNYYQYVGMLLYPFICLTGLKEVQDAFKRQLPFWQRPVTQTNQVEPMQSMYPSARQCNTTA